MSADEAKRGGEVFGQETQTLLERGHSATQSCLPALFLAIENKQFSSCLCRNLNGVQMVCSRFGTCHLDTDDLQDAKTFHGEVGQEDVADGFRSAACAAVTNRSGSPSSCQTEPPSHFRNSIRTVISMDQYFIWVMTRCGLNRRLRTQSPQPGCKEIAN